MTDTLTQTGAHGQSGAKADRQGDQWQILFHTISDGPQHASAVLSPDMRGRNQRPYPPKGKSLLAKTTHTTARMVKKCRIQKPKESELDPVGSGDAFKAPGQGE